MLLRVFLILAILAGAGVIAITHFMVKPHVQGIIDERNTNKENWDRETKRANKLQGDLKTTQAKLAETEKNLEQTQTELVAARTQADSEKKRADQLTQELAKTVEERNTAQQELAKWNATGATAEQVQTLVSNYKKAEDYIGVIEEEKKVLQKEVNRLKIELAKFLDPEAEPPMPAGLNGQVVVVDPKYDFVVLNIGEKQGVVPNGVLLVSRDSKLVAKVRVTSVTPDRSIANIISGWKLGDVMEGDLVVYGGL
jgi:Skp family chaperone for outer membrane proteins